jgi:hypothetical protein
MSDPLHIRLPDGRVKDVNHPIYNLTQHVHKASCAVNVSGHRSACTCVQNADPKVSGGS